MWELDHKEGQNPKNWWFQAVVLEKTLESTLDRREIKPVILKEISPEYSLERLMLKLKLQYFGHLMWRAYSLEKDANAGKDWEQEEKGTTEDEMIGWYHWFNRHGFEHALGDSEGQGSLACCSPWGWKELDMTERLNHTMEQLRGGPCWLSLRILHQHLLFTYKCDPVWCPGHDAPGYWG